MPRLVVNRKLEPLLVKPKPIKVVIGGRGSGKSIGIGDIMTMKMDSEGADIYCLREYQETVLDSVHRVFVESVQDRLGLEGWSILENKVVAPNGARTLYKGAARNPDNVQSAQGYKYSWFEEAHRASKASLDKLLPTILRNPGAECWFSANPQSSGDPFSQRFIVPYLKELNAHGYYEDELHIIIVANWRDNPWWNEEQERLRKWDYDNRPRSEYDWIWEGKFNDSVDNSIIKPEWFDAAIDAHIVSPVIKATGALIAGHDPFDDGNDAAGYALRHGPVIKSVKSKDRGEVDECCDWALDLAIQDRADVFVWDGDGMGTGLKGQIAKALNGKAMAYEMFRGSLSGSAQYNAKAAYQPDEGGKSVSYDETFKNNRAQFYSALARRFQNTFNHIIKGHYIDPDEMISLDSSGIEDMTGLRAQLCRIPTVPNGSGLIQLMSKQHMKTKLQLDSPNEADSVMMTMFTPATRSVASIDFSAWG